LKVIASAKRDSSRVDCFRHSRNSSVHMSGRHASPPKGVYSYCLNHRKPPESDARASLEAVRPARLGLCKAVSAISMRIEPISRWRRKSEYGTLSSVDEGRKRVLGLIAGILVARHLKTAEDLFDTKPSPRTESLVASAVQWADRIMRKVDSQCGRPGS